MKSRNFILPWPPLVNRRYFAVGQRRVLVPEVRRYRVAARVAVLEQSGDSPLDAMIGPLRAYIQLRPPSERVDIDSPLKELLDALQHAGVFRNDRQIREMHVYAEPSAGSDNACVEVTLETKGDKS